MKIEIKTELEVKIPGYYELADSFLFVKDADLNGIVITKLGFLEKADISFGKQYPTTVEMYVTNGREIDAEIFRKALLKELDEIYSFCSLSGLMVSSV